MQQSLQHTSNLPLPKSQTSFAQHTSSPIGGHLNTYKLGLTNSKDVITLSLWIQTKRMWKHEQMCNYMLTVWSRVNLWYIPAGRTRRSPGRTRIRIHRSSGSLTSKYPDPSRTNRISSSLWRCSTKNIFSCKDNMQLTEISHWSKKYPTL